MLSICTCSYLHVYVVTIPGVWQALLTYAQLMSILSMLEVKWPSVLQGLFKAMSWITHIAPKVCCLDHSCWSHI